MDLVHSYRCIHLVYRGVLHMYWLHHSGQRSLKYATILLKLSMCAYREYTLQYCIGRWNTQCL